MSAVAYHSVSRPRTVPTLGPNHVAHAPHGVDQFRLAALIDLLPQPGDHDVDDVRPGIEVVVPGVFGDQGARHDAAVVAHQILEHGVFLGRELDPFAGARDFAA